MDRGNKYYTQRNTKLAEKIIKEHKLSAADARLITEAINKQFTIPEKLEVNTLEELKEKFKSIADEPIRFSGLPTGLQTLDEEFMGVKRKDLVIIGAATGVGKSTLAMYMMLEFAKCGVNCLYMAFEDSEFELGTRATRMLNSNFDGEVEGKVGFVYEGNIYGYMADKYTVAPAIEAFVKIDGYEVVVIDMLNNLVDTSNDRDASEFINSLRSLATELGIVIILTCRLRKPSDSHEALLPNKYSFSGRSDITYSATKIITLVNSPDPREGDVVVIDSHKNRIRDRNKPRQRIRVKIDNEFKFTDLGGEPYASIKM